jgi:hypothetical protein
MQLGERSRLIATDMRRYRSRECTSTRLRKPAKLGGSGFISFRCAMLIGSWKKHGPRTITRPAKRGNVFIPTGTP